jgi:hypothetical protein
MIASLLGFAALLLTMLQGVLAFAVLVACLLARMRSTLESLAANETAETI